MFCFLLKLNDNGKPEVLEGNPFQCEALEQKIMNHDIDIFDGKNPGDKIKIFTINNDFTKLNIFEYKSSQGFFHFISDDKRHFKNPDATLIHMLRSHNPHK